MHFIYLYIYSRNTVFEHQSVNSKFILLWENLVNINFLKTISDETIAWELSYLEYCSTYEYFEVRCFHLRINISLSTWENDYYLIDALYQLVYTNVYLSLVIIYTNLLVYTHRFIFMYAIL